MSLYLIESEYYVEAMNVAEAVAVWMAYMRIKYPDIYDQEEPEDIKFLDTRPVIR